MKCTINAMIFHHIVNFLVDYITNLNIKKIVGGVIFLAGLALINKAILTGNTDSAILYAICGILVGGVGAVIIYYDMAKDKIGTTYNELDTISNAYKYKESENKKATAGTWIKI
jgi:hypothetical protein